MSALSLDERMLFERAIDQYLADNSQPESRSARVASRELRAADWASYAELGWLALPVPVDHGGIGGWLSDMLPVMEAAGRGLLLDPLVPSLVVVPALLAEAHELLARTTLPRIASGELRFAYGGRGDVSPNDAPAPDLTARRHGNRWLLNGCKRAVLFAGDTDMLVLAACDQGSGQWGLFFVEPDAHGIQCSSYAMLDDRTAGTLRFEECAVNATMAMVGPHAGHAIVDAERKGAVAVAMDSAGAMAALNALTLDYVRTRMQFGATLGSFQVIQHRLVDMMIAHRRSLALVKSAIADIDSRTAGWEQKALMCKAAVGRDGRFVAEQAIQLHGAIGMTEEYQAGQYAKRLLVNDALFGTGPVCRERLVDIALEAECSRRGFRGGNK